MICCQNLLREEKPVLRAQAPLIYCSIKRYLASRSEIIASEKDSVFGELSETLLDEGLQTVTNRQLPGLGVRHLREVVASLHGLEELPINLITRPYLDYYLKLSALAADYLSSPYTPDLEEVAGHLNHTVLVRRALFFCLHSRY